MDIKGITELIETVSNSKMTSLEIKEKDLYIKMEKENGHINLESNIPELKEIKSLEKIDTKKTYTVKSPLVGNFYSSPAPDKESYVKLGSKVKKGDVLCIIEAMKLMNEITSQVDGEIVKIYPKDGDMVEYGEKLFEIAVDD